MRDCGMKLDAALRAQPEGAPLDHAAHFTEKIAQLPRCYQPNDARRARPLDDHLARLTRADVFLDIWPCNAHTTAGEALWVGVPVVTLIAASFAQRVAASLLHRVGLSSTATIWQAWPAFIGL